MVRDNTPVTPPLARASIDRAASERLIPELVSALRSEEDTRVVIVRADRVPVSADGELATVSSTAASADALWAFLGRDAAGRALLVAAEADGDADHDTPAGIAEFSPLRVVGGTLPAIDAAIAVEAVCLGRWLRDAQFCPACGSRTDLADAGWSRRCPACGRQHFPRTDPAVIVAVESPDGERVLLGKNAIWAERNMYSTFAGFVEAAESLEATALREIEEEAGVQLTALRYRGSQAWPYPRSLMLGFHAVAADPEDARPDGEEIVDVRWFTRSEIRAALAGESDITLPGRASIARRLIEDWLERAA